MHRAGMIHGNLGRIGMSAAVMHNFRRQERPALISRGGKMDIRRCVFADGPGRVERALRTLGESKAAVMPVVFRQAALAGTGEVMGEIERLTERSAAVGRTGEQDVAAVRAAG